MFGQFKAIGSGIAAGTNIMARGQCNQDGSVNQSVGNIRGSELPIVRVVAIHTMEDVGELVFVLGVASQVI